MFREGIPLLRFSALLRLCWRNRLFPAYTGGIRSKLRYEDL
jgi:hypothetical protein